MKDIKQMPLDSQPLRSSHLFFPLLCIALVVLSVTSCTCVQPEELSSPLSPVQSPVELPESSQGLPEGSLPVGAQYTGDFNNDGQLELVSGYKTLRGGGIIVSSILQDGYQPIWQKEIPEKLTPTDFSMQDLNGDGLSELLLFAENDDTVQQYLFIYTWEKSSYVPLRPIGGPLEGKDAFLSLYWPPFLDDPDFNETTEIIVFTENETNPEMLSAIVYEWDGNEYHYSTNYIIPSRVKPTDR
jgi:hypothetical protein